jgi:hypothetical protein
MSFHNNYEKWELETMISKRMCPSSKIIIREDGNECSLKK